MASGLPEFGASLRSFCEKAEAAATANSRRICLKAFTNIVKRTPVLTGCARGNWRISFGSLTRESDLAIADKSGAIAVTAGSTALGQMKIGVDVFMCNSVPYIMPLEHGYSPQAPGGMVALTCAEFALHYGK